MYNINGKFIENRNIEHFNSEPNTNFENKLNYINNKINKIQSIFVDDNSKYNENDYCLDNTPSNSDLTNIIDNITDKIDQIYIYSNIQKIKSRLNFLENNLIPYNKCVNIISLENSINIDTTFLPLDYINEKFTEVIIDNLNKSDNLIFENDFILIKDKIEFIMSNYIKYNDYFNINYDNRLIKIIVDKVGSYFEDSNIPTPFDISNLNEFNSIIDYFDLLNYIQIFINKLKFIENNYLFFYKDLKIISTELPENINNMLAIINPGNESCNI